MSILEIHEVHKAFGDNLVLDDLSLAVQEHSCTVLIGASGSGKSTLLRCIALLERIDDGWIELKGEDITDPRVKAAAVRAQVGMVFQSYNLFPHMSVVGNVSLAQRLVHKVPRPDARRRSLEMLDRVGLADKADAMPEQLSGGQQQRVAIARALVNNPKVMLLDEVTSALDPELVGEVLGLLTELKNDGMTMIVATHEMSFARDVADEVCFLHQGAIHERGPASKVLGAPEQPRTQEFLRRLIA